MPALQGTPSLGFQTLLSFSQAVNDMNGKELNGKVIYVGRAQKRLERQGELKRKFELIKQDRIQRYQVLDNAKGRSPASAKP